MSVQIAETEQGRALQEAVAKARDARKSTVDPATIVRISGELQEKIDAADAMLADREAKDRGRQGDAAREALADANKFDQRKGQMRYDDGGTPWSPTEIEQLASFDLVNPIPEDCAGNVYAKYLYLPTNDEQLQQVHRLHDQAVIVRGWTRKKGWDDLPRTTARMKQVGDFLRQKANILNPDDSGYGAEFMPVYYSAQLVTDIFIRAAVASLFPRFTMPRKDLKVPAMLADIPAYRGSAPGTTAAWQQPSSPVSELTSTDIDFNAERLQCIIGYGVDYEEDAIISVARLVRTSVIDAIGFGIDDAITNGSTLLTDLDNAAATKLWASDAAQFDVRASWDGLVKDGLVTSTTSVDADGSGSVTADDFLEAKGTLGKYASENAREDCRWIVGVDAENVILGFDEVHTVDKYGPQATIHRGEIGQLYGMPVIVSGKMYGAKQGVGLAATGKYTGSGTTARAVLVNTRAYWIGDRSEVRVAEDISNIAAMKYVIAYARLDFQKMMAATAPTCCVIFNIA